MGDLLLSQIIAHNNKAQKRVYFQEHTVNGILRERNILKELVKPWAWKSGIIVCVDS